MLGDSAAVELLNIVLEKAVELPPSSKLREVYLIILHRLFHVVPRIFYETVGEEQRERRGKIMDVMEAILDMSVDNPKSMGLTTAVLRTKVILDDQSEYFEGLDDPLEFPAT
jgi:hypothetical protein|mmetsp:Transcript_43760/g.119650  ORF Transcript_43760/g.119650 Transcript_43760/m.119650 type:complete len:112 (+) Transcript_43760:929-1264(+)